MKKLIFFQTSLLLAASLCLSFVPLKAKASETIVSCKAGRYYIEVQHNSARNNYTYTAYDGSTSSPSLILRNGSKRDGRIAEFFTFKNGNYSYVVAKKFEGRGGEVYLSIYKSKQQIFYQQCQ